MTTRHTMTVVRTTVISIEEVAGRSDTRPELVKRFVSLGLIEPADRAGRVFPVETTARVQKILRLHRDLNINYGDVGLVLDLLERIEVLEARLERASSFS